MGKMKELISLRIKENAKPADFQLGLVPTILCRFPGTKGTRSLENEDR